MEAAVVATDAGARRGPMCPSLDPVRQRGDLLVLELALGGHLHGPLVADGFDQRALVGLSRHDDRSALAPLEHGVARVEPQAPLGLLRPVAFLAAGGQDRPDLRLEELLGRRVEFAPAGLRIAGRRDHRQNGDHRQHQSSKIRTGKIERKDKPMMSFSARKKV